MMTRKPSETRAVLNKHADWADPHVLAGRGRAGLIVAGLLIGAGALTDTLAFKNTLELALPQAPATQIWLMAAGVTSMALIAAAGLGIFLAIHRRDARNDSKLAAAMTAVTWIGLGLAMFLVWWPGYGARTSSGTVGILTAGTNFAPLVALFFAAIYFISGACTVFEAERLYNPEYVAFRRLAKQYRKQAQRVAEAEATVNRARSAVEHHVSELDRENDRRQAAIAERRALGAEAANYARILMAAMLRDPAKTGLTETGPSSLSAAAVPKTNELARLKADPDSDEAARDEEWEPVSRATRAS